MEESFQWPILLCIERLRHVKYSWQNMSVSKAAVLLTSFEQQSEHSQLLGTGIEVNTSQVITENVLNSLLTAVALQDIEIIEDVESLVQNMAGTTGKVASFQISQLTIAEYALLGSWG